MYLGHWLSSFSSSLTYSLFFPPSTMFYSSFCFPADLLSHLSRFLTFLSFNSVRLLYQHLLLSVFFSFQTNAPSESKICPLSLLVPFIHLFFFYLLASLLPHLFLSVSPSPSPPPPPPPPPGSSLCSAPQTAVIFSEHSSASAVNPSLCRAC